MSAPAHARHTVLTRLPHFGEAGGAARGSAVRGEAVEIPADRQNYRAYRRAGARQQQGGMSRPWSDVLARPRWDADRGARSTVHPFAVHKRRATMARAQCVLAPWNQNFREAPPLAASGVAPPRRTGFPCTPSSSRLAGVLDLAPPRRLTMAWTSLGCRIVSGRDEGPCTVRCAGIVV